MGVSVVSKDANRSADTAGYRRIRDDAIVPKVCNKFLFRKQPFPIGTEVINQVKGSRFDLNDGSVASQLPKRAVQHKRLIAELGEIDTSASLRFGANETCQASAVRRDGGIEKYNNTAKPIISVLEHRCLKSTGLVIPERYATALPLRRQVALTNPNKSD